MDKITKNMLRILRAVKKRSELPRAFNITMKMIDKNKGKE